MVSALAIDGAAIAIVASAAIKYPNFFIIFSSVVRGFNRACPATFPRNSRKNSERLFTCDLARAAKRLSYRMPRLFDDRLIHHGIDLLTVVPTQRSGYGREINHRKLFLRVDPPIGAAGAGPRELSDRSHQADHAGGRA